MPRGKTTHLQVRLTPTERQTIRTWQQSSHVAVRLARRGRILLLLEDGLPISQVAERAGISRRHVYKWVRRFQAQGLAGLADLPRPGPWHIRRRDKQ